MKKIAVAASTALLAGSALAVDVTAVTTAVGDAGTAAGTVGAAVLVMVVGIKVFKWIRQALG